MKQIITLALVLLTTSAGAQPPMGGKLQGMQRLESMQIAYLTRELALTPEEAQQFWPVYNKYRKELKTTFVQSNTQDPLEREQKMLDIRKKYREEFAKSLGKERANKVFGTTEQFRKMVKEAAEKRREPGEANKPPHRKGPRPNHQRPQ